VTIEGAREQLTVVHRHNDCLWVSLVVDSIPGVSKAPKPEVVA
jgi:hypothetical protein